MAYSLSQITKLNLEGVYVETLASCIFRSTDIMCLFPTAFLFVLLLKHAACNLVSAYYLRIEKLWRTKAKD